MARAGRCLVTGAGGFIGSALARHLESSADEVWRLVRPGDPLAGADRTLAIDLAVESPPLARLEPFDAIFHLAGRAHRNDRPRTALTEHLRVTVEGTRRLLEAAKANGAERLVFASSVAVLGDAGSGRAGGVDESASPSPRTPYGRAKLLAEELLLDPPSGPRPNIVVLRLPLVYGPGQKGNLGRMLRAIAAGRFPPPPRRPNRRSVVHVADVVEALAVAARHPSAAGRIYHVAEPEPCSTREIYEWSCEALGRSPAGWSVPAFAVRAVGLAGELASRLAGRSLGFDSTAAERLLGDAWCSPARIERELGFRPGRRLRDELPRLLAGDRGSALAAPRPH